MGKNFSCGLAAGIVASVVTHPADVIKTSMQLFPSRYQHRTREAILSVYRRLGVKGFFSGLMPRLVRRSLVSALSWTVYDRVRETFDIACTSIRPWTMRKILLFFICVFVAPGHAIVSSDLENIILFFLPLFFFLSFFLVSWENTHIASRPENGIV
jgi:hypothetical protein